MELSFNTVNVSAQVCALRALLVTQGATECGDDRWKLEIVLEIRHGD